MITENMDILRSKLQMANFHSHFRFHQQIQGSNGIHGSMGCFKLGMAVKLPPYWSKSKSRSRNWIWETLAWAASMKHVLKPTRRCSFKTNGSYWNLYIIYIYIIFGFVQQMAKETIMVNYDQSPGQSAWGMAEIGISWRPKGSQKPTCDKGRK